MQEEPLSRRVAAAVDLLEELPARRQVTLFADADVDGAAAAALLARALHRSRRRFRVVLTRRRDERLVQLVKDHQPAFLITADLGASVADRLGRLRVPGVILDHHEPQGDSDGEGFIHVNPHLVGEDASSGASGAAVSFRFAEALLARHGASSGDLLPFALLGAWGDRYHGAGTAVGLHARLVGEARDVGVPTRAWEPDAPPDWPVSRALCRNLDPVVVALAGDEDKARRVLGRLGLADVPFRDLEPEGRKRLVSWVAASSMTQRADPGLLVQAVGRRFCFPDTAGPLAGACVAEVAVLVDAAARQGRESTALAALLGDDEALRLLRLGMDGYADAVGPPVWRAAHAAVSLGPAHLVRLEDGRLAGAVADRLMAWTPLGADPVVVMGPVPRGFKLSLRARPGSSWRLDRVARDCARVVGGAGGGHRLAAGALVPEGKEAAILEGVQAALRKEAGARAGPGAGAAVQDAEVSR